MDKLQTIDLDKISKMNEVSANMHYNITMNLDENDAEATAKALVDKYPGVVMRVLSQKYIRNLATLEAVNTLMSAWGN